MVFRSVEELGCRSEDVLICPLERRLVLDIESRKSGFLLVVNKLREISEAGVK